MELDSHLDQIDDICQTHRLDRSQIEDEIDPPGCPDVGT